MQKVELAYYPRTKFPKKTYKKRAGRKGFYNATMPVQVFRCAKAGCSDEQIAALFNVDINTIHNWKRTRPEFMQALEEGRKHPDHLVENAFYQSCIGYSHPEEKIFVDKGQVIRVQTIKHYPPNVWACYKWLTIRDRERWTDIHKIEQNINLVKQIDFAGFEDEELAILERIGMKQLIQHAGDNN